MATNQIQALELIESGVVLVNGSIQKSPTSFVDTGSALEFLAPKAKYVSRGGLKLEKALEVFNIDVTSKRCLDIGSSTGGFTDCLLQHGADHVVSVDVGHGQLDLSIRNNENVSVFEKTNAKSLTVELIGGNCDLGVMDVSFTSVIPLINPVGNCLDPMELIVLIKPQFECEQKDIDARGIVNSKQAHISCIHKIIDSLSSKLVLDKLVASPITGNKGNIEYLCRIAEAGNDYENVDTATIEATVEQVFTSGKGLND